jgi:hypothetical protein
MAGFTRTNGLGHAHATLYSTANLGFYTVNCGGSLAGEGGIGKAIEAVAQALNPIAFDSEGTAGLVNIVVDGSQWDADAIDAVLQNLGTAVGSGNYNMSAAAATVGGQFIVSA